VSDVDISFIRCVFVRFMRVELQCLLLSDELTSDLTATDTAA